MATLAEQAVDALNATYGSHPGARAVHAKGLVCAGSFTAGPAARELTTAAHMQGQAVPVTARFSNASGAPHAPDGAPDGRGLAVKMYLPDGSRTDIVAVTLPVFFVRTPEDFVTLTRAASTARGRLLRLPPFLATHPEVLRGLAAAARSKPPASFATVRYNGLHAFRWLAPDGTARFVRYSWLPRAGEHGLSLLAARRRPAGYLHDELRERFEAGPVSFDLQAQVARSGDPTDDPTKAWPADRDTVVVGTLELTGFDTGRETGDDVLVFDPTRVTPGIECGDDPILRFRSAAYSESVLRRTGVARGREAEPGTRRASDA